MNRVAHPLALFKYFVFNEGQSFHSSCSLKISVLLCTNYFQNMDIMSERKKMQKGSLFDDYIMQKYCRFILDSLVTKITFY